MKAAVFKGPGRPLAIETLADPTPETAELVIKVGRCGVCGTDLHRTEGHAGQTWPSGSVLGHEFAGEVVATGAAVEGFKQGDLITALPFSGCGSCSACRAGTPYFCRELRPMMGGFAEYMRVGYREAFKLPASLSLSDGALVEPLAVGVHGVRCAGMAAGSRVLVMGAGPIGLATMVWARHQGATNILSIATSRRREALALDMGATRFLLADEAGPAAIEAALGGEPDVVFEAVGVPGQIARAIEHVRPGGTVVAMGLCLEPDTILPAVALRKAVRLVFSVAYDVSDYRAAIDAFDAGHVDPRAMLSDTVGFDEFPAAFETLRTPSACCKLMLDPWSAG